MKKVLPYILLGVLTLMPEAVQAQKGHTVYKTLELSGNKSIPYAVHLPDGYKPDRTYPVLIGPGDAEEGTDPGYYWKTDPYSHNWIIVDAQIWKNDTRKALDNLLDQLLKDYNVEGNKFHTACWSANSAAIFSLVIAHANRFHSITGMAGNPGSLSSRDIRALEAVRVQFVVGEDDPSWQRSARRSHKKLEEGGVQSTLEIVPDGKHVLTHLIGKGFMMRMENMR